MKLVNSLLTNFIYIVLLSKLKQTYSNGRDMPSIEELEAELAKDMKERVN